VTVKSVVVATSMEEAAGANAERPGARHLFDSQYELLLHWPSLTQATHLLSVVQTGVSELQAAFAPVVASFAAALHVTQTSFLQAGVAAGHEALVPLVLCASTQGTQRCVEVSQAGVAPEQVLSSVQPKHAPFTHAGAVAEHCASVEQAAQKLIPPWLRHWFLVATLQSLPWLLGLQGASQWPVGTTQTLPPEHWPLLAHGLQVLLAASQWGAAGSVQSALVAQPVACWQQPLTHVFFAGHWAEVRQLTTPGSQVRGPCGEVPPPQPASANPRQRASGASR
jgi:hypothetical protein